MQRWKSFTMEVYHANIISGFEESLCELHQMYFLTEQIAEKLHCDIHKLEYLGCGCFLVLPISFYFVVNIRIFL